VTRNDDDDNNNNNNITTEYAHRHDTVKREYTGHGEKTQN
jgi:hypothetical protein